MTPRLLTRDEYVGLLSGSVENVTDKLVELSPEGVIDIEPYVAAIPKEDLEGHSVPEGVPVEYVYRTSPIPFDLVQVMMNRKNVYLVIAVDLKADSVHGHYLLNLNREYGLE